MQNDELEFIELNIDKKEEKKEETPDKKADTPRKKWIEVCVPRLVCAILLVILLVSVTLIKGHIVNSLREQNAYKNWDRGSAGHVSVFLNEDSKTDTMTIGRLKNSLIKEYNKLMGSDAYDPNDLDSGPFVTAYCAPGSVSMSSEVSEGDSYAVFGVGGDYFYIHKPVLMSGDYLYPDSSKNLILLDSISAFKLFGSVDVVGEKVMVNNVPHFVSGVYKIDDSYMSKRAGSENGFVYMTYDSLSEFSKELGITCIEFVGTNPTEDFLMNTIKESSFASEDSYIMVQNSSRFGLKSLLDNIVDFPSKVMLKKAMVLPFWENIARGYEEICAYLLIVQALCCLILAIFFFLFLDKVLKSGIFSVKHMKDIAYDIGDRRRGRRRRRRARIR